jgi:nicotinamidase-related amidase
MFQVTNMVRLKDLPDSFLKNASLLIIDVQSDVCNDNGAFARSGRGVKAMQKTVENGIIPFIERARGNILISYIRSMYSEYQNAEIPDLLTTEWGREFYLLEPAKDEEVFLKNSHDPFKYTDEENGLEDWLKSKGIKHVFTSGFTTDRCIREGVYKLLERGYTPIVLDDCVSTADYKLETTHIETIREFENDKNIGVISSKSVIF